jgi:hypothetical protein
MLQCNVQHIMPNVSKPDFFLLMSIFLGKVLKKSASLLKRQKIM